MSLEVAGPCRSDNAASRGGRGGGKGPGPRGGGMARGRVPGGGWQGPGGGPVPHSGGDAARSRSPLRVPAPRGAAAAVPRAPPPGRGPAAPREERTAMSAQARPRCGPARACPSHRAPVKHSSVRKNSYPKAAAIFSNKSLAMQKLNHCSLYPNH